MKLIRPEEISLAVEILKNDGLVAFPTDTLYGLGGNAYSSEAVQHVFECKGRDLTKPFSVCYSSLERAAVDVEVNEQVQSLAKEFLPGPLTLILKKKQGSRLVSFCSNAEGGVGIRVPDNKVILDFVGRLDFPLTATSANKSGEVSPKNAEEVQHGLQGYAGDLVIIDGGSCSLGMASTIVDLCGSIPKIIRAGAIDSLKLFEKFC